MNCVSAPPNRWMLEYARNARGTNTLQLFVNGYKVEEHYGQENDFMEFSERISFSENNMNRLNFTSITSDPVHPYTIYSVLWYISSENVTLHTSDDILKCLENYEGKFTFFTCSRLLRLTPS